MWLVVVVLVLGVASYVLWTLKSVSPTRRCVALERAFVAVVLPLCSTLLQSYSLSKDLLRS